MKNKVLGILFSAIFGFIGTIPWIIIGYFGWIASIAGYVIGLAAYKGYTIANKDFDKVGKISIALVILIAVPVAEIIGIIISGLQEGFPLFTVVSLTPTIFAEYFGEYAKNILIGYAMAALGTYRFFVPQKVEQVNAVG